MYACADKEYEVPSYEIIGLEKRDSFDCEFRYCNPKPWTTENLTFSYLGCPFQVSFEWRKCSQGVEAQNFTFTFDVTNSRCTTVIDSIGEFWLNNQSLQANTAYNAIYSELLNQTQNWILAQLDPNEFPISTPISFQFVETDCHTLCVVIDVDFEQNVTYEIGHVKCGESCCKRTGDIRYDANGDAYIFNQFVVGDDNCEPTTINCDGSYNSNICTPACDRL